MRGRHHRTWVENDKLAFGQTMFVVDRLAFLNFNHRAVAGAELDLAALDLVAFADPTEEAVADLDDRLHRNGEGVLPIVDQDFDLGCHAGLQSAGMAVDATMVAYALTLPENQLAGSGWLATDVTSPWKT